MMKTSTASISGSRPLPAGLVLLLGLVLAALAGCRSAPSGDLEVVRTRPNLPDIHDIEKLERDWGFHEADEANVIRELRELRALAAPTPVQRERIEFRERRLAELAGEARTLEERGDVIVQRIAADETQVREVFEQLEQKLAPLSQRSQLLEQKLMAWELQGQGDVGSAQRARDELEHNRRRLQHYEGWQNRIVAAGAGYERTREDGWPVLAGSAERRRAARLSPASENAGGDE